MCVCILMAQINPFIAVSLKSKLLEGYCNACAHWAQFSWCHLGGVCTRLGPAIAACSYFLLNFFWLSGHFWFKKHIHCLILITLQWFVRCMKPIASMWQLWVKVIAPPTGSRKCVIFKMLWIQHLTFTQFASNFIRIMTKHGRCETVKGILISKILLPWQRVKPQYSFLWFWGT